MFKYMPSFEDVEGRQWDLMTIDFVVMGFGRGLFITAHNKELDQDKTFTCTKFIFDTLRTAQEVEKLLNTPIQSYGSKYSITLYS